MIAAAPYRFSHFAPDGLAVYVTDPAPARTFTVRPSADDVRLPPVDDCDLENFGLDARGETERAK